MLIVFAVTDASGSDISHQVLPNKDDSRYGCNLHTHAHINDTQHSMRTHISAHTSRASKHTEE